MTQAKLTALVQFYNQRLDNADSESDFDRGCRTAYSIAKIMTENIVFGILDKQLADMIKPDEEGEDYEII